MWVANESRPIITPELCIKNVLSLPPKKAIRPAEPKLLDGKVEHP